ncbi:MAG: hypothetical protein ACOVNQ_16605, partial [Pirellula sp.]
MASFSHCLWSILNFTPYIQTSIEPGDRLVIAFVGLGTPTLLGYPTRRSHSDAGSTGQVLAIEPIWSKSLLSQFKGHA